ncbi:MAG: UDP-N-acetylmuramate--L-alanine ligase [Actinobacteria bacterium]|nr:UDP-N-acetylmuramate--L-alanine ligase [Actinomycetota bacterium]
MSAAGKDGTPRALPEQALADSAFIETPRAIHVVGAGGAGMSSLATALIGIGHRVSGSDLRASANLKRLEEAGATVYVGHRPENVVGVDLVTASSAIPQSNPELEESIKLGIPVWSRARTLAAVCSTRRTVAVAGTHGKTTTSSMLAVVLVEAGFQPSYLIGGELNDTGAGAVWGEGEWLVAEADESDGTFLALDKEVAVVTNVEPDHLDHYGSFDQLEEAFAQFVGTAGSKAIASADDTVASKLARKYGALTFGLTPAADYRLEDLQADSSSTRFVLSLRGEPLGTLTLPLPGVHNARNAAAAAVAAMEIGAPFQAVRSALGRFTGVARRFEYRGEAGGVRFVDDYAHLPGEVRAALAAAKLFGPQRLVCVFQPHRYSRTAMLAQSFGDAFDDADLLVVTDVYSAGEQPRLGITGKLIVDAVAQTKPGKQVVYLPFRDSLLSYLLGNLKSGDLCITLGAGDLTTLADQLIGSGSW